MNKGQDILKLVRGICGDDDIPAGALYDCDGVSFCDSDGAVLSGAA